MWLKRNSSHATGEHLSKFYLSNYWGNQKDDKTGLKLDKGITYICIFLNSEEKKC